MHQLRYELLILIAQINAHKISIGRSHRHRFVIFYDLYWTKSLRMHIRSLHEFFKDYPIKYKIYLIGYCSIL